MFEVLSILISHKLCISYCNTCDLFKWLCLTCFADGDENGGEGPGEEQQGPQKPKKVLTLTIMCNLTGQENSLEIHLPSRPVNFIFHFPPLKYYLSTWRPGWQAKDNLKQSNAWIPNS